MKGPSVRRTTRPAYDSASTSATSWSTRAVVSIAIGVAVAVAGCSSEAPPESPVAEQGTSSSAVGEELSAVLPALIDLPSRAGEPSQTSGSVPHIQLDAQPVPGIDAELRRRVFLLPGIDDEPSDRSLPGARGLMVGDELSVSRPDVIAGSREFAHVHPDGSLHVWLPAERAREVQEMGWGELHPWTERDGFWGGVVLVFTPRDASELDVVIQIVVEAYNFVVGADLQPVDIS